MIGSNHPLDSLKTRFCIGSKEKLPPLKSIIVSIRAPGYLRSAAFTGRVHSNVPTV